MQGIIKPEGLNRVLLHCCCAPCASSIVEWMVNNDIKPFLFYFNPNIYPVEEYEKRKNECTRHAQMLGLDIVDADYNHADWLKITTGFEAEPERGSRCLQCFKYRLLKTAEYAKENGFDYIATTLASSRWKDINQIAQAGEYATSSFSNVTFWNQNWRKAGLSDRRNALIKEYNFYNQQYCGCEFSMRRF